MSSSQSSLELSESEFACYADSGAAAAASCPPPARERCGAAGETLNPRALYDQRERDALLVMHVREGTCEGVEHARELLVAARWDIRRLLRSDEPAVAAASGSDGGEDDCPCCLLPLGGGASPLGAGDSSDEPTLLFTGCPTGARHGVHADCMTAYVGVCIADAAATKRGTVACPRCVATCSAQPGVLTEAQVASLVSSDQLEMWKKARARLQRSRSTAAAANGRGRPGCPRALFTC